MARSQDTNSLTNSKIVIIGGTSGIGFATAQAAAGQGAHVVIASGNAGRVVAALKQLPDTAQGFTVNVNNEDEVKALFSRVGAFDHLVYTAGENIRLITIADMDVAEAKEYFNIRYWGALTCSKYAAPYVKQSITFTSGVATNRPGAGWSLGASMCGAMESFTRAMAVELAPVRVNVVSPGVVKTPLWDSMTEAERQALYSHYAGKLPVGWVAEADDIAKTYLYLINQQYTTGQVVIVDGGAVLV